jgi:hypothetical protein
MSGCRTPNYVTGTTFHLLRANAAARSSTPASLCALCKGYSAECADGDDD